ncbi:Cytochrome c1 heme lyase [Colletotrichum higginsianum IMI 349063]|uniref:Holocytochrome c-type synthase n=3 Tax=Colletotrichum higginsianum TaxID=80884 RepID=A0A1B7XU66_COLHI|nr:Cytochrome c1 heme lyase [Colletotrichum higginsianum IMI 349063]OBR03307.1 Cytochrome c1 heme lyase [Colletotrichum higginsianum IMI 349063]TIC89841.1 putative cytochrome c1 heme lyase [Colletotrichum higginsianum]
MNADLVDLVFLTRSQPSAPIFSSSVPSSSAIDYEKHAMPDPNNDAAAAAPETCPVDHKAREAWLQHARAANPAEAHPHPPHPVVSSADISPTQSQSWTQSLLSLTPFSSSSSSSSSPASNTTSTPPSASSAASTAEACPVDHKSREAWLAQARAASATANPHAQLAEQQTPSKPLDQAASQPSRSWTQSLKSYIPFTSPSSSATQDAPNPARPSTTKSGLDTEREVSTIPRTATSAYPGDSRPSNHEQETGADEATGNWIYPSQKMFFDAMKRKGHDTRAADMATVVPIHNAVNERAWKEIKEWEQPYLEGTACDGPKLHSFLGLSTNMSPKARINTLLGYTPPFDRHDWIVDRCGVQVEYVIDFYAGRPDAHGKPSFYLDVRPKLNSWEGVKMRALRGVGLS